MYVGTFSVSIAFLTIAMKNKNKKNIYVICTFFALFLPALLAGLRDYSIGWDLSLYGNAWFNRALEFKSITEYIIKANEYGMGTGYAIINYLCSRVSSSAHFFYFVYAMIQMVILYFALKDYDLVISIPFAFFVYFYTYYNSSLNILRQIMAILIVLLSYKYVFKNELIKFLMCITIAVSFHNSAVIAIILYPVNWFLHRNYKRLSKILVIGISVSFVGIYSLALNFISTLGIDGFNRYSHYMTDEGSGGRYIRLFFWSFFFALFYMCKRVIVKKLANKEYCCPYIAFEKRIKVFNEKMTKKKYSKVMPQLDLIEVCIWFSLIGSLINYMTGAWLIRIFYYFDILSVLYIPLIARSLYNPKNFNKYERIIGYILIATILFMYWLFVFVIRNGPATYPYKFMQS